jgi:excisionase family DNA binding protein
MEKEILSTKEAAAFLGISQHQIYKLSSSGRIPTYSPTGRKIYFVKSELEEWVFSGRRATVKDINSQAIKFINFKTKKS